MKLWRLIRTTNGKWLPRGQDVEITIPGAILAPLVEDEQDQKVTLTTVRWAPRVWTVCEPVTGKHIASGDSRPDAIRRAEVRLYELAQSRGAKAVADTIRNAKR